jgi:hypothetical protein
MTNVAGTALKLNPNVCNEKVEIDLQNAIRQGMRKCFLMTD